MEDLEPPASPEALRARIVRRHSVRLHCTLILVACFATGLVVTKLLLMAGVSTMWIRYFLALVAAYATFLFGIRIWLRYAGFDAHVAGKVRDPGVDLSAVIGDRASSGGGSLRRGSDLLRAGGGRSGGGGASAGFHGRTVAETNVRAVAGGAIGSESGGSGSGGATGIGTGGGSDGGSAAGMGGGGHAGGATGTGGGGSGGWGLDFDGGLVLLALALVVLAVTGAVIYLVWAAPTILADAAFAAMLSAGLVRSTRRIASGDWVASVVGNTWIAFVVVAILAIGFAVLAQGVYPQAQTLPDVLRHLRDAKG